MILYRFKKLFFGGRGYVFVCLFVFVVGGGFCVFCFCFLFVLGFLFVCLFFVDFFVDIFYCVCGSGFFFFFLGGGFCTLSVMGFFSPTSYSGVKLRVEKKPDINRPLLGKTRF